MSDLPPGWTEVALGDLARFVNGAAFKESEWGESGHRIVRIQNLTDPTKPYNRTERRVKDDLYVEPGDLLVSWSATLGVFEWAGPDVAVVNQHIFRVIPSHPALHRPFLKHLLRSAIQSMQRHTHGATMKHINRGEFLGTKVPLPPLEEQRRIAAILDKADELRAKRRAALDKLDSLTQSIFLDMFGDPGNPPQSMSIRELGDVASFLDSLRKPVRASDRTPGNVPYYGANGVQDYIDGHIFDEPLVLLAEDGGHFEEPRRGIAYRIEGRSWVNNHAHVIRAGDLLDTWYLTWSLRHRDVRAFLTGSTRHKLTKSAAERIPVAVPPIESQRKFGRAAEQIQHGRQLLE